MCIGLLIMVFLAAQSFGQSSSNGKSSPQQTGQSQAQNQAGESENYFRLSKLMGKAVQDPSGNKVGTLNNVVLMKGKAQYVVIALQNNNRLVPVPWNAAKPKLQQNGTVLAQVTQNQLSNAPSFQQNQWPNFSQNSYEQKIRGYYGQGGAQGQSGNQGQQPGVQSGGGSQGGSGSQGSSNQ